MKRLGRKLKFGIEVIVDVLLFQNASAQAALQAASALSGQNETQGGPNTVLRVIIEHMVYPVTLEVLCQVSDGGHIAFDLSAAFQCCVLIAEIPVDLRLFSFMHTDL
jgi:hypothetical protein